MLSMHQHARAQAMLYPLRRVLPPVSAFFAEPFCRDALDALEALEDSDARVGLFRGGEAEARGGFDLYVPESWDGREALPLIVALHGGSGNGADFLWSWLREARSRRCLLLAPTSRGSTWSLDAPELDGRALAELVEWLTARWQVDRDRVLLTGLSDGATMTLLVGLGEDAPYTHLAPISGVLHPRNFALGNLERARAKPIRLVHGALDWLFPVSLAREAARVLEQAGADLAYHEIGDLSHTYPREENARLIEWLDPTRGAAVQPTSGES
jgi:phospholipase/carboxylesterase